MTFPTPKGNEKIVMDIVAHEILDNFPLNVILIEEERSVRRRVKSFCKAVVVPAILAYRQYKEFSFDRLPKVAALELAQG